MTLKTYVYVSYKRHKNLPTIGKTNGCYTYRFGMTEFPSAPNGSKSFTAFPPWKSAIEGNGGRLCSADYCWQLKSDDTYKRKSNDEVFSMCGISSQSPLSLPQFGRVKSRRITGVGKSPAIFTSILSRRSKPVKSFESRQIYA